MGVQNDERHYAIVLSEKWTCVRVGFTHGWVGLGKEKRTTSISCCPTVLAFLSKPIFSFSPTGRLSVCLHINGGSDGEMRRTRDDTTGCVHRTGCWSRLSPALRRKRCGNLYIVRHTGWVWQTGRQTDWRTDRQTKLTRCFAYQRIRNWTSSQGHRECADLPGAVGANVPIGKGSVGACIQRKNWRIYYLSGVSSSVGYRCEVQTFASEY